MALTKTALNTKIDSLINKNDRRAISGNTLNGVLREIVESCFNSVSSNMANDNLILDDDREHNMNLFTFKMVNGKQYVFTASAAPPSGESSIVFQGYGSGLGKLFGIKNGSGSDAMQMYGNKNVSFYGSGAFGGEPLDDYRLRVQGTAGSGSIQAEGYSHFRNQYPHPSGEASFKFSGYGVTGGDKIVEVLDGYGNQLFRVMGNGLVGVNNILQADTYYVGSSGISSAFFPSTKITMGNGIQHIDRGEMGSAHTSHNFTSANLVTFEGSKIFEFSNYTTVHFGMDKDGRIYSNSLPSSASGLPSKYWFAADNGDGTSTIKIIN